MSGAHVTVLGSVFADYVVQSAEQPLEAVPFRHGGVARNVAENLGWLGTHVKLVTLLTPDPQGAQVRARLEQAQVRLCAREVEGGLGQFVGLREPSGEVRRQRLVKPAYEHLHWDFVREQLEPGQGYLVMETGIPVALLKEATAHARTLGLVPVAMPTRLQEDGFPLELLRRFGGVVANSFEASTILGTPIQDADSALAGVQRLLDEGLSWAIITLGALGVVAAQQGQGRGTFSPALPASVVSTLGAGDAFISGFLGSMCLHGEFRRAVRSGLEMSRRTVEVEEAVRTGPCTELLAAPPSPEVPMVTTIGIDADDTLWHNENLFADVQQEFRKILAQYHSSEWIDRKLLETERKNLDYFGYGAKGFALSMIETAIELTEGRVTGTEIQKIIDLVKGVLKGPTSLLEGAREAVTLLAQSYRLILITKGDLFEQEAKLARSGLAELFHGVEIVSEKNTETYQRILAKHGVKPGEFLMVGNSVRSDILPVVQLGERAVHVPYHITWAHEVAEASGPTQGFATLARLGELMDYLRRLGV
jgi:FMN phosphatase YigB (HAD superfamily)/sugar/nucleoside kinase (ribokinase family)